MRNCFKQLIPRLRWVWLLVFMLFVVSVEGVEADVTRVVSDRASVRGMHHDLDRLYGGYLDWLEY